MPDFELDRLKKTWQEQDISEKYSQNDILQMLDRKSRNYVKYIFWISMAEFILFTTLGFYYLVYGDEADSLIGLLERLGGKATFQVQMNLEHFFFLMKILGALLAGVFVVLFYLNHRRIRVEENLKSLILRIVKFRRTVNLFVAANLIFVVIFIACLTYYMQNILAEQQITVDSATRNGLLIGIVAALALCLAALWLYYRLIYGILVKRLGRNLDQLRAIERESRD